MNTNKHPRFSIVIPVFNQWSFTLECLKSLRQQTPGAFYEVIVVDNGSQDETASELETLGMSLFGEQFRRLRFDRNQGFGPACNAGAEAADGRLLFFLNNDTLLTDEWHGPLLTAFEQDDSLGAAGPLLLYPDTGRVQHLGIAFGPTLHTEHLYAYFPADHRVVSRSRPLQAVTAAALMLPKALFDDIGGFHPGYRNGSEDLELCCRIRERGKTLRCIPQSIVYHLESATPGRFDHDDANAALLKERCTGCFHPDLHLSARKDGFRLGLTPWLETYLRLQPEVEQELNAALEPFDPARCQELLAKEPLFEQGYVKLAEILGSNAMYAEEVYIRYLHVSFFPSLEGFTKLLAATKKAEMDDLSRQTMTQIETVQRLLQDKERLRNQARAVRDKAREVGEEDLAEIYAARLKELEA